MNNYELGLVESALYLQNDAVDINSLAKITQLPKATVVEAVSLLKEEYDKDNHGLEILEVGGGFCFSPKKQFHDVLKNTFGRKSAKRFSKAALETLAVVAYSQPVTKSEIESIRGVSADGMIKLLTESNLIREVGKRDSPGKPVQYGTTKEFLLRFGLASIADLPKLDEINRERFSRYER